MIKKTYKKNKETIHNFIWRSLQIFGKQGITFLIFILCAKLLTPYDFGIYNYILAVIFFLILFTDFGVSTAISKYVAEFNAVNKKKLKFVLFNSLIIIFALGFIVTILTLIFGPYFLQDKYTYLLYTLPLFFLIPISSLYDGIFRGLKRFKELAVISLSIGLFSIIFVYLLVSTYGLIGALVAQVLFYLVLVLFLFFRYKTLYFQFDKKLIKNIVSYSFLVGISAVGYFLYTKVDVIMLGQFGFVQEIGYYEIAHKVIKLIVLPFMLFGQVIAPNIARLHSLNKYEVIKKKYLKHLLIFFVIGVLITLILLFIYPLFLDLFLNEYLSTEAILIFYWLIIILPTFVVSRVLSHGFLVPSGNARYSLIMLPMGVLNIILNYIFISLWGFIGVVYSTVICMSLNRFLILWRLYKKIDRGAKQNENK